MGMCFSVDKMYVWCYFLIMSMITLSATKARNNFFDVLNQVMMGQSIVVERNDKPIAMITSVKPKTDLIKLTKALKASKGIVKENAYKPSDNLLRKAQASNYLGKWDL